MQILSGDTRSNGHRTASAPMEVELRNESEMPANFNWNIPVNMEACHLVRRCEKVARLISLLSRCFGSRKLLARSSYAINSGSKRAQKPRFGMPNSASAGRMLVAPEGWLGSAWHHITCAMRCPCQGHIPPRGRQLCTVIAVPSNLVEDGGPPHAVFLLLSPVRLQCSRHLTFYHNSI